MANLRVANVSDVQGNTHIALGVKYFMGSMVDTRWLILYVDDAMIL